MTSGVSPGQSLESGNLDELSPEECWGLVATQPVGRVAVIVGHYPVVFPVNFAVDGKTILYRTGVGTKLHSIHRSNVTFEVDAIDPVHHTGWSVMIKGVAQELSPARDRDAVSHAEFGGATPWASGDRAHLIRIIADQITGRRIRPDELSSVVDNRGFL
jgi:nitroimidazol reductase NimA-like FMN-containing flavoprotein (pyridoxamine 5'-phosphate oxidase superfamily)